MYLKSTKNIASIIIVTLSVIICIVTSTNVLEVKAQASAAGGDLAVPISTKSDFNITAQHLKDYKLDAIATALAKRMLHDLTGSVVNWINSGYKGGPSFLTNPGAFFLDSADQVTGAFIAGDGPLSRLCSPFSLDIRLSIALNQAQFINQRYTCTLGSIINNVKNTKNNISINGQNINNFTGSNFHQGGWAGFLALTTEPQNNPYGGFLQGQADLYSQISAKQNRAVLDLQLGSGFLSYTDCQSLGTVDPDNEDDYATAEAYSSGTRDVNRKVNSDGTVTYEKCTTQTPGSVIAGTLQKSLDAPTDQLELANDINAVVNAAVVQMTKQLMGKGLASIGKGKSNTDYSQQIINQTESISKAELQSRIDSLTYQITTSIQSVTQTKAVYDQEVDLIGASKNKANQIASCNNTSSTEAKKILAEITPVYDSAVEKQTKANEDLETLRGINSELSATGSIENIQRQMTRYTLFLQGAGSYSQYAAVDELTYMKQLIETWDSRLVQYGLGCTNSTTP